MTTIADQNDKWASYAKPGGWNGKFITIVQYENKKHTFVYREILAG